MSFNFNTHPFTSKLTNVKQRGANRWECSCPCTQNHKHADKTQSLSVSYDPTTDNILIKCHAGCDSKEIVSAVGCTISDLFGNGQGHSLMNSVSWYASENGLRFGDIYQYGNGYFKVRFYDSDGEKTFRWIHADATKKSGYAWNKKGFTPRLYVAGSLTSDNPMVIVVEGEKDADTVYRITGITAVSADDGATHGDAGKKWVHEYTDQLTGKIVYILYDNDESGRNFAQIEANNLIGKATSVKMMDILTVWPECPEKGDITDLADTFGDEETKKKFDQLFDTATPAIMEESINGITVRQATEQPAQQQAQKELTPAEIAKLLLQNLSDVKEQGKRYIFKPYLPIGKFSILNADPGVGKTKVASAMAALVTTGSPLLGIKCERPGKVLLFSMEDDAEDFKHTVRACGGDVTQIATISEEDDALKLLKKHKLTYDSPIVEEMIKLVQPVLVIFDPYQKYLPKGVDMNRSNETSDALAPVVRLAKQYDCHIMIIGHNTKAQTSLAYKFMGSQDFLGEARSGMSVVRDPERVREQENLIIHVKSNNKTGKAIRYRIESIPGNEDYARIEWLGLEDYTEADYAKSQRQKLKELDGEKSPLTIDNPIVQTIFALLKDNPDGVAIGYEDFKDAKDEVTGSFAEIRIEPEISKISAWLDTEYGVGVSVRTASTLKDYYLKGVLHRPNKNKDRQVLIRRNRNVDIQQQAMSGIPGNK